MRKIAMMLWLVCASVFAADWKIVDFDESFIASVDLSSIAMRGTNRMAWIKLNYAKPQKTGIVKFPTYRSTKALYLFNCKDRLISAKKIILFSGNDGAGKGKLLSYRSDDRDFEEVVPDTMIEMTLDRVCAYPLAVDRSQYDPVDKGKK